MKVSKHLHFTGTAVLLLVSCCLALAHAAASRRPQLTVAAAADLQHAMPEIVAAFEKSTGSRVTVTYGSSGNLFTQIQNGAPFDIFLAADSDYPCKLVTAGFADRDSLTGYALGHLVLWVPQASRLDVNKGMNLLLSPEVRRIAIANPRHAPYGRAAVEAMRFTGVYDRVRDKLVFGENISQAAQFVQSGNAQIGLLARSLVFATEMKHSGRYVEVPPASYAEIDQTAVVVSSSPNKELAHKFVHYLRGARAVDLLRKYGFVEPASEARSSGK